LLDEASTGHLRSSGLYIYDLTKMLSVGEVETYEVAEAVVGHNSHIDYSHSKQTYGYVEDYNKFKILPIVHRNVSHLFGMQPMASQLIWREERGVLTALDNNWRMKMWSKLTGKEETFSDSQDQDQGVKAGDAESAYSKVAGDKVIKR